MKQQRFVTYQLILKVKKPITLTIGALGQCFFPKGTYIYTGSAKKNLEKRLQRHLKKDKPLRWHIDYLTTHEQVEIVEIRCFTKEECDINQQTPGQILISGFGASDCRNRCGAHLKYTVPIND